jgi:hypothetical protein
VRVDLEVHRGKQLVALGIEPQAMLTHIMLDAAIQEIQRHRFGQIGKQV